MYAICWLSTGGRRWYLGRSSEGFLWYEDPDRALWYNSQEAAQHRIETLRPSKYYRVVEDRRGREARTRFIATAS